MSRRRGARAGLLGLLALIAALAVAACSSSEITPVPYTPSATASPIIIYVTADAHADAQADGHTHTDAHTDTDGDTDGDPDTHPETHAKAHAEADGASETACAHQLHRDRGRDRHMPGPRLGQLPADQSSLAFHRRHWNVVQNFYQSSTGEGGAKCSDADIQSAEVMVLQTAANARAATIYEGFATGSGTMCLWITAVNAAGQSAQVPAVGQT